MWTDVPLVRKFLCFSTASDIPVFQNGVLFCKEPFQALPALSGQVLAAGFKGMVNQWVSICKVALAGTGEHALLYCRKLFRMEACAGG